VPGADLDSRLIEAGLLEGVTGKAARQARLRLLRDLAGEGVPLEELRRAVAEDRLALLPVDRVLAGDQCYTPRQVSDMTGVPLAYLQAARSAAGLARPAADECAFGERDMEAARATAQLRAAGIPDESMLEVSRVVGRAMAQTAEVIRQIAARLFMRAGVTEHELAVRNAQAAQELLPLLGPLANNLLRLHVLEQVREQAVTQEELTAGTVTGAREIFVGFVDMVGFTRLGERIEVSELEVLVGQLGELATEAVRPPVRLVKTIGDAAMFVSAEPVPLIGTALAVVAAAEELGDGFPPLRGGVAGGLAVTREGDWYGHPVNLASRITEVARPGSVLVTRATRNAVGDAFSWSPAGSWSLKGLRHRVPLYRARPLPG
jgi:adenylate cyclase